MNHRVATRRGNRSNGQTTAEFSKKRNNGISMYAHSIVYPTDGVRATFSNFDCADRARKEPKQTRKINAKDEEP
jgi:hypothetical protein